MRRTVIRGASVLLVAAAAACSAPPAEAPSTALTVCSTGDYRPFTYRDADGQWSGMDIDLVRDFARESGAELQLVPTTWPTLMTDLGQKCELAVGGISVTADRAARALFSDPYLRDGKAAIVRCADAAKYQSLPDIDRGGVRVVVNPGGTNEQFDRAHLRHATIVEYPDNNTIFDQVIEGRADVMITDGSEIRWQALQHPQLCGVSTEQPFTVAQKAYLMPKSAAALQQRINKWLSAIQRNGSYAAVSRKWLG
ncbi:MULTISPECIES: transporter substrate-binding domain-containing protein [Mycolicibacterium]|uniref:transporter substrate-binding domain-containing protein n=1 Tax=Mycolicibacterium TaxID=1866885 RepID=UPI000FACF5B8|nr:MULTISPECIES: transporter substrate-binding domain-containing protein [Mycolicibacterium]RUP33770.1 MAG: transporter substrate-binding domain-containing protein [Mycolicibacterium sp.]UCZ62915.1 transporter substrate-binding domain-containing protein [Mycolicibacterium phocaicum]